MTDAGEAVAGEAPAPTPVTPEATTDAAALSAAREAMGKADTEAPPTPDAPAAPPSVPATPDALTELGQLRAEIRAKEQEQKQRERLDGEYKKRLDESLAAERTRLQAEVRAELVADYRNRMRLAPADTITEFGVDGVDLVRTLAERAGPQGQSLGEIAKLRAELDALKTNGSKDLRAEIDAIKAERAKDIAAYHAREADAANRQLVTLLTEKTPASLAYYGGEAVVVKRAQEIADEYCAAKGVQTCPYGVIVQELEAESRKGAADRLKSLDAQRSELAKLLQQPAGITGAPTEMNGRKGPRTLSAQGASERRASPKPASEMSASELDEASRAAAREALGPRARPRTA